MWPQTCSTLDTVSVFYFLSQMFDTIDRKLHSWSAPGLLIRTWAGCAHDGLQHGVIQRHNHVVPAGDATAWLTAPKQRLMSSTLAEVRTMHFAGKQTMSLGQLPRAGSACLSKSAYSNASRGRAKIFGRIPSCAAWPKSAATVDGLLSADSTATPAVTGRRTRPYPFLHSAVHKTLSHRV